MNEESLTQVSIGGLELEISHPSHFPYFDPTYLPFLNSVEGESASKQIQIQVVTESIDEKWMRTWKGSNLVIDTAMTWALQVTDDPEWRYHFGPSPTQPSDPPVPHCLVDSSFKKARIFFPNGLAQSYPLDEVLARHVLLENGSLLVHAAGVTIDNRGYLFLGDSGAGKSTIAELLESELGSGVIHSDDRIILREQKGRWYMYGTPWHGTFPRALSKAVEVKGFFYLEKAEKNFLVPLDASATFQKLSPVCLGVWWLEKFSERQFEILEKISSGENLCHWRLGFRKDASAAKFVLSEINKEFA